jgi:hypothetical protein
LGPSTSSSTRPSSRFLTPPQSPRCDAMRAANARYPTPWTFPFTKSLARRAAGSRGSAIYSDRPRITKDAYPTNGYSHTSVEASRVLRFRASECRTTILKRKKEMLEEIRWVPVQLRHPTHVRGNFMTNCWGNCSDLWHGQAGMRGKEILEGFIPSPQYWPASFMKLLLQARIRGCDGQSRRSALRHTARVCLRASRLRVPVSLRVCAFSRRTFMNHVG